MMIAAVPSVNGGMVQRTTAVPSPEVFPLKMTCGASTVEMTLTSMMAAGMAESSIASGKYERYLTDDAIPRYGKAADVARAVRFFLEPDNYVTGQVLIVDGGMVV